MRILIDVAHPAHVHFFRHLRTDLLEEGHEVRVVARDKEVTIDLLRRLGIEHVSTGPAATGGIWERSRELVRRVLALRDAIRAFSPHLVLTRNPSGVQAASLSGVPGVFDTDDGTAAGLHLWTALPFARVVTSPECLGEDFGGHHRQHRRYPGFKALAYLHPDRFRPDPGTRDALGVEPGEPFFVIRFSAYSAAHDRGVRGLSSEAKRRLINTLNDRGQTVVLEESPEFPEESRRFEPHRVHDVLAAADLCVGDSQTVTAEAAMLGTPAIHLSGFSGRIDYLSRLEERYGLVRSFGSSDEEAFLDCVHRTASDVETAGKNATAGHRLLLAENVDVTAWYLDLVHELLAGPVAERSSP